MSPQLRIILSFFRRWVLNRAIAPLKRRGILLYLKSLQVIRLSIAGALLLYFALQVMVLGFLGAVVTGIWLMPFESTTRLWIVFGVCLTLFLVPALALAYALSDRVWFENSGARDLIGDLAGDLDGDAARVPGATSSHARKDRAS